MKKIQEQIKNRDFAKVYLLYGEEEYLKRYYKKQLVQAVLKDTDQMNYSAYEGKGISFREVIDVAETLPFFADKRIILIEDSGFFKKAADEVADYISQVPDTTVLVFVESEVDKRGKLFKRVKEFGYPCECKRQSEKELTKWILGMLGKDGKKIKKETLDCFLEKTGLDMECISTELEKLLCYTLDREVIETKDVEEVCTARINGKIFEMVDAMGNKNQRKTLSLYYDLIATKEPPMRILFMLTRQFNILMQVKSLLEDGRSQADIAGKMGLQSFIVGKSIRQVKNFTTAMLKRALEDCIQTEEWIKTGRMEDKIGVELLLVNYTSTTFPNARV